MARIALVSDVTPVPATAGPMVLYRHFMRMRQHELLVVSGTIPEPDPAAHWEIIRLPRRHRRLLRPITRPVFEEIRAVEIVRDVRDAVEAFRPHVVLSVWTAEYLLAAARLANDLRAPLVLICHDDLESMLPATRHVRWWARRRLGGIYRSATARLCVSDSMCETFERRYGAPGTVMYPLPEAAAPTLNSSSARPGRDTNAPLRMGFFGNLGDGHLPVLLAVADELARAGGTLHFASTTAGPLRDRLRSHAGCVDCGTFASSAAVMEHFSHTVDAMLCVQGFSHADTNLVATQFPSKLTEYAQLGLPMMVVAPPHASTARWAAAHPDACLLCTELVPASIRAMLRDVQEHGVRSRLSARTRDLASRVFHPAEIHAVLERALEDATARRART